MFINQYRLLYTVCMLTVPAAVVVSMEQGLGWWLFSGVIWAKILHTCAVQISLHRYLCHSSFTTTEIKHQIMVLLTVLTAQGSAITWCQLHSQHHRHSDSDQDPHSPNRGLIDTVLFWPIQSRSVVPAAKHLVRDKLVLWTHRHYFTIWYLLLTVTVLIDWKITVFLLLLPAGLSLLDSNFITNYLGHRKIPGSYRNFHTRDNSWNNRWLQLWDWGGGLHNNHHQDSKNYCQAVTSNERDLAAWIIDRFLIKN